jgi:hypothetical protein
MFVALHEGDILVDADGGIEWIVLCGWTKTTKMRRHRDLLPQAAENTAGLRRASHDDPGVL